MLTEPFHRLICLQQTGPINFVTCTAQHTLGCGLRVYPLSSSCLRKASSPYLHGRVFPSLALEPFLAFQSSPVFPQKSPMS